MRLYKLNRPMLSVMPTNPATLNNEYNFAIMGLSVNSYTGKSLVCTFSMKFTVVDINNMVLWPTGKKMP